MIKGAQNGILLLLFVLIFLGAPPCFYRAIRWVENATSRSITMTENRLEVTAPLGRDLYCVSRPDCPNPRACTFDVLVEGNQNVGLQITELYFSHRIFIDGELVSQNTQPDSPYFDSTMRQKTLRLEARALPYSIRIEGQKVAGIRLYLAEESRLRNLQSLRQEMNACFALIFLVAALICLILGIARKRMTGVEIAVLIVSGTSLIKTNILGEISLIHAVSHITPELFQFMESLTSLLNIIFLTLVYLLFFDVRPRRILIGILIAYGSYSAYCTFYLPTTSLAQASRGVLILFACRTLLYSYILGFAVLKRRPFAWPVIWVHALASGLLIYYGRQILRIDSAGSLSFMAHAAFLAFVLQFYLACATSLYASYKKAHDYDQLLTLRGIEHDLKIPLSIVKLNHQMIRKYCRLDEKGIEYSDTANKAIIDIESMLRNISLRLNSKKQEPHARTSVKQLLQTVEYSFQALCIEKGAVLTVTHPHNDTRVSASEQDLKRVFFNLIDNALKYSHPPVQINITTRLSEKTVELMVTDNGIGMTPQEIKNATHMFYKADKSRNQPGLGIGLHVVKILTKSLLGTLSIQSKKEVGTTVTITLPALTTDG
jgi:signal transduction histidine kinase